IRKFGSAARDAVSEFMPDDIEGNREAVEQFAIAVAEYHLIAIPERVVVAGGFLAVIVMDGSAERKPVTVDGIPLQHLVIKIKRCAETIVGLVNGDILSRRVAFGANQFTRQSRIAT